MLDTSYGFNNLLKEVLHSTFRDTSTFQDLRKLSSRTYPMSRTSPTWLRSDSDLMVTPTLKVFEVLRETDSP